MFGCFEIVKLLLDSGADTNARGGYFGTALSVARESISVHGGEIAQLLLERGAVDDPGAEEEED